MSFNPDDVIAVAKGLMQFGVWHESYGDHYPYEGYECQCCDGIDNHYDNAEDFRHEKDCPILIAQDILTGVDYEVE